MPYVYFPKLVKVKNEEYTFGMTDGDAELNLEDLFASLGSEIPLDVQQHAVRQEVQVTATTQWSLKMQILQGAIDKLSRERGGSTGPVLFINSGHTRPLLLEGILQASELYVPAQEGRETEFAEQNYAVIPVQDLIQRLKHSSGSGAHKTHRFMHILRQELKTLAIAAQVDEYKKRELRLAATGESSTLETLKEFHTTELEMMRLFAQSQLMAVRKMGELGLNNPLVMADAEVVKRNMSKFLPPKPANKPTQIQ